MKPNINVNHPNITDFKRNEIKTLEYLFTRQLIPDSFAKLSADLSNAFLSHPKDKIHQRNFKFHSNFDMEVETKTYQVVIGANVSGDYDITSYYLAICSREPKKIIRKFHFDYQLPEKAKKQPIPVYHLQYGGELADGLEEFDEIDLDSWLSVPRLNFYPINTALLLDLIFCEFRTRETINIIEKEEWRTLILENERFLAVHYFKSIYNHINNETHYNKFNLLRDIYYGKSIYQGLNPQPKKN